MNYSRSDCFQFFKNGHGCIEGKFQLYKFMRDITYLARRWIYCLFEGGKNAFSRKEVNWNFIKFSMRICIEKTFDILK